jgi:hypothetical protein
MKICILEPFSHVPGSVSGGCAFTIIFFFRNEMVDALPHSFFLEFVIFFSKMKIRLRM